MKICDTKKSWEYEGQFVEEIQAKYCSRMPRYRIYCQNRRKDLIIKLMEELKRECNSLLDVGGAQGLYVEVAESLGYFAVDCDIARSYLLRANKNLAKVEGDAQELPFKDNAFDLVMMNRTLEYVPDDEKALSEAARVARKYLIASVPNKSASPLEKVYSITRKKEIHNLPWGDIRYRRYTAGELANKLGKRGESCY